MVAWWLLGVFKCVFIFNKIEANIFLNKKNAKSMFMKSFIQIILNNMSTGLLTLLKNHFKA